MELKISNNNPYRLFVCGLFILFSIQVSAQIKSAGSPNKPQSDSMQQQTGEAFVNAFNARDIEALRDMLDINGVAESVGKELTDNDKELADFKQGFVSPENHMNFAKNAFGGAMQEGSSAKLLKILNEQGKKRPLIRVDVAQGGHEYIMLHVTQLNRFNDVYFASSGKTLGESVIQASRLMFAPSDSLIKRMFGRIDVKQDLVDKFQKIGELRRDGNFTGAFEVFNSLPENVQNERVIIDTGIVIAQNVSEDAYLNLLGKLATHYGNDPTTQFMLIDYYTTIENFEKVQLALDNLIDRFGADGALYNLKANIAFMAGDNLDSIAHSSQGIETEPEFMDSYWTLVHVLNQENRYSEMVKVFDKITQQFNWQFTAEDFKADPNYEAFTNSPAFAEWL